MRISAERHYNYSRRASQFAIFALLVTGIIAWGYWTWPHWLELNLPKKILIVVVTIFVGGWVQVILGNLLLEVVRQLTSARCSHCQGKTRYVPNPDTWSENNVIYLCDNCGQHDLLTARYCDEAPKPSEYDSGMGPGGGGG